jgi:hypothetical protein
LGFDPQGNLFVANLTGTTLTKVTPQGHATPFSNNLPDQVALTVDSVGNIYIADRSGNVYRVVDNGQTVDLIDHGVQNVTELATDVQRHVYVAGDSNTVVKEAFNGQTEPCSRPTSTLPTAWPSTRRATSTSPTSTRAR